MKPSFLPMLLSFSLAIGVSAGGGGGDDPDPPPGSGLQAVQIVYKGSFVTLTSSRTDITPGRLLYTETGPGTAGRQFDGALQPADFQRLAALVDSADLIRGLAVRTGPAGPGVCRSEGYDVSITRNDVRHDFSIPGSETCGSTGNPAMNQLSALHAELLFKYLPPR